MRFAIATVSILLWNGVIAGAALNPEDAPLALQLESTAFSNGKEIPSIYTCEGGNISPPLSWAGVPGEAHSLVLIMSDPDVPAGTWNHWILFNIPKLLDMLPKKLPALKKLINGEFHGRNSFGKIGYGGPCPPSGTHRYFFRLYALDRFLPQNAGATVEEIQEAMKGHVLARGELMGTYQKKSA